MIVHNEPSVTEVSRDPARRTVFESLLAQEHYLSYRSTVGENLKYLLCLADGRPVAAWLFGAAAWRCEARDQWIGWSQTQRASGLQKITNNTRVLIPQWVRVDGLASWGWARVRRRLRRDWLAKYGHAVEVVETFVDRSRFHGGCYKASNWLGVGLTRGRGRQDRHNQNALSIKAVYVCELNPRSREKLCQ